MNHSKTHILFSLFVLTVAPAMIAAPAMAGILAGDSTNSYLTIWHGSTPYQGYEADNVTPSGLTGYVDWAVYAPGSAPPGGFDGYAFPGGEYIYAYQVFETGSAALSSLSVDLDTNIVDSQGDFDTGAGLITGDAPNFQALFLAGLPPFVAFWSFDGVPQGGSTDGLVYASPYAPIFTEGNTIDDGTVALVLPVPSPQAPNAPEPSTFVLALLGLVGLAFSARRLRRRGG